MNLAQQYRYFFKPLVFAACALPAVLMTLAAFGHGPMDLGADPVRRLEHACGITALNLLLITLAVTPVREITGLAHLLRLRRMLGLFAFFYALAHFTVYFTLDQWFDWRAVGEDIIKRPYITIGMLALLLLVPHDQACNFRGKGDFHMDGQGRLTRRRSGRIAPFIYTGVQLVSKRLLRDAPEGPFSTNLLWSRAIEEGRLFGAAFTGQWFEVGEPAAIAPTEAALSGA